MNTHPLRVTHLISSSGFYGAERVLLDLMTSLPSASIDPTLIVFDNIARSSDELIVAAGQAGIDVSVLPCRGRFDRTAVSQLKAMLVQNRAQIVHSHGYKANLYAYLASRRLPIRWISTCHGYMENKHTAPERIYLRRADMVVSVSPDGTAAQRKRNKIPSNRSRTISNGFKPLTVNPTPPRDDTPPRIGSVGRLAPEKGIDQLLIAAAHLLQRFPDLEVIVTGDGPVRQVLENMTSELGIEDAVDFRGYQSDVSSVYSELDILVQPSLREGLPMTILEAMGQSVAVVATAVGGVSDLLAHGRGVAVPPADSGALETAIEELLRDPTQRRELAIAGSEFVREHHTRDSMATQYAQLYAQILAPKWAHK